MLGLNSLALDERFLATGDEAGTAPDDRRFRPDVEGLRAVAVLLVVLYHANKVEFRLSGGGLHDQLIGFGSETFVGWLCYWHTSAVANGRYRLMTIAHDASGKSVQSKSISLSVEN